MEWNCWWSVNTVTPFLFESSGDSEEYLKSDHLHVADDSEGVLFRFDDEHDVDHDVKDDDAQSCSYDHSSYINTTRSYDDDDTSQHDKSQRLIYDDDDHHEDGDIDDGDDDDDDNNNHGESKLRDSSKRQKISHEFCGDNLLINLREIDIKFWEACLAS